MPSSRPATLVIVPLYKNAALVEGLIGALLSARADFEAMPARLLFINDSPGDAPLNAALKAQLGRLDGQIAYELLVNAKNLGFIGACNRGMAMAAADGADVVLLNSDALVTPGALLEMAAVARLDPMTGFVSPRSNNATICNSPYPDRFRGLDFAAAQAAHRAIEPLLPRQTYVPTDVGFCLLIRHAMMAEFGLLDPVYGAGYNEETDFILRCNRRGYRAVMANHAFVYHLGSQSFSLTATPPYERERKNRKILLARYPEYERAVERYFAGAEFHAQSMLGGLVPDADGRLRVLFHCPYLHDFYNGTFEMTVRTIAAFVEACADRYVCFIACNLAAFRFHGLDKVEGLTRLEGSPSVAGPFFAALRLSQPFSIGDLVDLPRLAPITGYVMHDTIALDCQNLDEQNLTAVWEAMGPTTGLMAFVSAYSREQFNRRFETPAEVVQVTALLSTDAAEYRPAEPAAATGDAILVIGNHYAHKHAVEMVDAIHALDPAARVILLGVEVPARENLASYRAGGLDPEVIEQLYAQARVVVFPSHYEGFGLPVMQTLARERPLLTRPLPPFVEISARTPLAANIHVFGSTDAMAKAALEPPPWDPRPAKTAAPVQRWSDVAQALAAGIEAAHAALDFPVLRRRLSAVEALAGEGANDEAPARRQAGPPDGAALRFGWTLKRAVSRKFNVLTWKLHGTSAADLIGLGDGARDAGDFEAAADAYRQALRRRPSLDGIWVQYGHAVKENGDRRAAEAAYRRAIALNPDIADTHLQLGHVLKNQNRLLAAKDSFEQALVLDPDMADASRELARMGELGGGHMRKAILLARNLVKTAPPGGVIGCVIARGAIVVGAGASAGEEPHAVDQALGEAGGKARGAVAYLTLDPPAPQTGRLVKAGLERVVIACEGAADAGEALKAAGVIVDRGFLAPEARMSLHYPAFDRESVGP